jgi:hypothetical protein
LQGVRGESMLMVLSSGGPWTSYLCLFWHQETLDLTEPALLCCQVYLQQLPPFCKTTPGVSSWTSQLIQQTCNEVPLTLVDLRGWVNMPPRPSIASKDMSKNITPPYDHQRCGFCFARLFLLVDSRLLRFELAVILWGALDVLSW